MRYFKAQIIVSNGQKFYGNLPLDFVKGYEDGSYAYFPLHDDVVVSDEYNIQEVSETEYNTNVNTIIENDKAKREEAKQERIKNIQESAKLIERAKAKVKTYEEIYKEIDLSTADLQTVQGAKIAWLVEEWQTAIQVDFTSSLTGADGKPIVFGYTQLDQDNYKKQGVLLSLDTTVDSIQVGTVSHGVVTLTRDEYIQFVKDCNAHEMPVYLKFDDLRRKVKAAKTNDEVDAIQWT